VKILVISLAGIGDTLLATPLIHELRANFPDATIDVLTKEAGARDLLENNPHLSRVYYKNLMRCGKAAALAFVWSLRRNTYDLSINTHPQSRMVYRAVARTIGAKTRLSHEYECFGWLDRQLCNRILPQDYSRHSIDNNLDVLPLIGARRRLTDHRMEIFFTAAEEKWAEDFLAANQLTGKKTLGLHVGSGGTKNLPLKRWPLHQYVALVERLNRQRPDIQVLLFGGPEETKDHQAILARADRERTREIKTPNLRLAAALIRRCHAFLSVDTALMHVAAAIRTPNQMVIEAPTLNVTNWPHGNHTVIIPNPRINGRGLDFYRYDGGDIKGTREELLQIMESVTVAEVFATVTRLI
jgi:ADP-heptose:LPS heptosyltransferase